MKKLGAILWFISLFFVVGCDAPQIQQQPPYSDTTPVAVNAPPKSDWTVLIPQVNRMDGSVIQGVTTGSLITLDLCFENGKPCKVRVAIGVPRACYIEGNFEDWNTRRKLRVKFDDGKPRIELWVIADGHHALIPPRPTAFIAELHKHKTFWAEFGCAKYDQGEVNEFHIDGLQMALNAMKQGGESK